MGYCVVVASVLDFYVGYSSAVAGDWVFYVC